MTKEDFKKQLVEEVKESIKEKYGLDTTPEITTLTKTNVERESLSIRFAGSNIAPSIPVQPLYEEYESGMPFEQLVEKTAATLYEGFNNSPELPELTIEEAKKHITLTLVNSELNKKLLDDTPHFDICDGELSAIPRWYINEEVSFVVKNELVGRLGLTPDEVLAIGKNNIDAEKFSVMNMADLLADLTGQEMDSDGPTMIVLSTEDRIQGARALLSEAILNNVHDMIGDFVVLPSSVHEVICVPKEGNEPDALKAMVQEINETQVSPEERLSNEVFLYNGISLSINREPVMEPQVEMTRRMAM